MLDSKRQNVMALASLTGLSEDEAAAKLDFRVCITEVGQLATTFGGYLRRIAGLTVEVVTEGSCELAISVNGAPPAAAARTLYMRIDAESLTVTEAPPDVDALGGPAPDIGLRIAACYAAGIIIKQCVGDDINAARLPFEMQFAKLGITHALASNPIHLSDTVLAGAGGVSSGFLWALEGAIISGELDVADPKAVASGNFNRHLHFMETDLHQDKAPTICKRALLPNLKLTPFVGTFGELRKRRGRVKRVIVTVDSRTARRSIQNEMPLEVLDASTTDVSGVVVHSHCYPSEGACLACIYKHIPSEDERARSVAEGLGITVEEAKQEFIDQPLAKKLSALHTLDEAALIGTALNTLYRAQCGQGALRSAAGKQALAPFAFVSVLAGALLALELMRLEAGSTPRRQSNYLQLNPWFRPHGTRQNPPKEAVCEFCSKAEVINAMSEVWADLQEERGLDSRKARA